MAKLSKKLSFANAFIEKDEKGIFTIEEFDGKGQSIGKFNLTEKLEEIVGIEGVKLSYDTTDVLDSQF